MAQAKTAQLEGTRARLLRHLARLKEALPPALEYAFDHYFEAQVMRYLKMEARIDNFQDLLSSLEAQLAASHSLGELQLTAGRLSYVADELDRLEAEIYRRPRRRRRFVFSLSDFFKASQGSQNGKAPSEGELHSLNEAYEVLELEAGCTLLELTAAFRRMAKRYHPDVRGGDRSDERSLRRVLEAYQMLKEALQAQE